MVQTTEALLLLAWVHCTVNFVLHPGGGAHNYLNYAVKQIAQLQEMGLCNMECYSLHPWGGLSEKFSCWNKLIISQCHHLIERSEKITHGKYI